MARNRDFSPSFVHPAFGYKPPRYFVYLKIGLGTLLFLAVFSILWVGVWFLLATQFRGSVLDWVDAQARAGLEATAEMVEMQGFPLKLSAQVTRIRLAEPGAWSWKAERIWIDARPWNPTGLSIRMPGEQKIAFVADGRRESWSGGSRDFTLELDADATWRDGGSVTATDARFESARGEVATAGRLAIVAGPESDDPRVALRIEAEDVALPRRARLPLGRNLEELDLVARLQGRLGDPVEAATLAEWRDGGGTVDLEKLFVRHGPVTLKAGGTLALDAALQPVGNITAKVTGFYEALTALERVGAVRARDAVTAKLVLGVLAKKAPDGGQPTLSLPITLRERTVSAGPVPLAKLAEVTWPGAAEGAVRNVPLTGPGAARPQ